MKIKNISKKAIAISVIAIVAFSMVGTAALLTALSNKITVYAAVPSKDIKIEVWKDGAWSTAPIDLVINDRTAFLEVKVSRDWNQDAEFFFDLQSYITCTTGITDATEVSAVAVASYPTGHDVDTFKIDWVKVDTDLLKWTFNGAGYDKPYSSFIKDQMYYDLDITFTFNEKSYGTYTIDLQAIPKV
jgi:hypothetical protein